MKEIHYIQKIFCRDSVICQKFGYNGQKWLVKPDINHYVTDNYNAFDETHFIKGIFYAKNKKKKMSGMWLFERTKMGKTKRSPTL